MRAVLRSLHVYPVKSLRGITRESATLTDLGLEHDRAWLLVDGQGQFMSQRRYPAMATIDTRLESDCLVLSAEGQSSLAVPFLPGDGRRFKTRVWDDDCDVLDEGDDAARWFASALRLDTPPRLVRMAPGFRRTLKRPERYGDGTTTFFADTAPLLVANTASLAALNEALEGRGQAPVPMDRFRANLVIEGPGAFEEHRHTSLEGEACRIGLRYPRERCVMTTLDQATGARDPSGEPFRTLRDINPMPDNPRGPAFGELGVVEAGSGAVLRCGDRFELTGERGPGA
ncbi:MAG: MOSC N-terminal beta barrel domain-containing protein [Xanthomonadales bacterium]|jgi:uncharacterized protein YcbX|nr:MOSC N-terminal beta barrel domain-containing protein [Xanthomonadales bacterium]